MSFRTPESVLLLVDLQARLMPAIHDGQAVVDNALRLGRAARLLSVPVLATAQNPGGLGANVDDVTALAERTLDKRYFDATREPAFTSFVPPDRRFAFVAGCEAHVCVLQTTLGLLGKGFAVRLVADAIGSRVDASRQAAIARAAKAGAEIVTTEMVIFEWLQTCDHPRFRDCLKLVK